MAEDIYGVSAFGAKLYNTTSGSVGDEIGGIKDIAGPTITAGVEDATHHGSPEGWEEFAGTTVNPGTLTFELLFNPAGSAYEDMMDFAADRTKESWRLEGSSGDEYEFDAIVTIFSDKSPVKGLRAADITMQRSGKPTYTPAP